MMTTRLTATLFFILVTFWVLCGSVRFVCLGLYSSHATVSQILYRGCWSCDLVVVVLVFRDRSYLQSSGHRMASSTGSSFQPKGPPRKAMIMTPKTDLSALVAIEDIRQSSRFVFVGFWSLFLGV